MFKTCSFSCPFMELSRFLQRADIPFIIAGHKGPSAPFLLQKQSINGEQCVLILIESNGQV